MNAAKAALSITDPSKELFDFGSQLKAVSSGPKNKKRVFEAFAKAIEIDADAPELMELVAAVTVRIHRLSMFGESLPDSELDDEQRTDIRNACESFRMLLHPKSLLVDWEEAKRNFLSDTQLTSFNWFSRTARRHKVLKRLTDEERKELLIKIESTIQDIGNDHDFAWAFEPLIVGLQRLYFILRHISVFGHEAAIEQLVSIHRHALLAEKAIADAPDNDALAPRSNMAFAELGRIFALIAVVGTIFCLPDQALTAMTRYRAWIVQIVTQEAVQHQQQKFLPPPIGSTPEPSRTVLEIADGRTRRRQ